MKKFVIRVVLVLLTYNIVLLLLTVGLSMQSTLAHPMKGRTVDAGELQLHVIESDKPQTKSDFSVVLVHGASTSALDFSTNLQPILSDNWHVLSIDRPGHGYSERGNENIASSPAYQARMVLNGLHNIGIANAVLVGHSWAGSVVMAALLEPHEHVTIKAGVLIAGATHPWDTGNPWHVEIATTPISGDMFRWQYINPIGRLMIAPTVQTVFNPETVPENYIENTGLTLGLRPTVYKYNAADRTELSAFLNAQAKRYADITQPLLSIAASGDTVVPAWNHHDRLIKQIDHLQHTIIEGAGHAPHHTRPGQVADLIDDFLGSL